MDRETRLENAIRAAIALLRAGFPAEARAVLEEATK